MAIGRPSQGIKGGVELRTVVSKNDAAALKALVAVTGEGNASHLRRALARYLADVGLNTPGPSTPVTPTSLTKEIAR